MKKKYMKVIESLSEIIMNREETIELQKSEIDRLQRKLDMIEAYVNFHEEKVSNS